MGTYVPTITPSNAVTIYGDGATSYEEIANSMGSYLYEIKEVYLKTISSEQLLQPIVIAEFDVNGEIENYNQIVTINPFQYQNSSFFKLTKENIVLNSRTSLNFDILPNESVDMVLYVNELSNAEFVAKTSMFETDFFENYAPFL